ncbi:MAG: hypothetical protein JWO94_263 [Verrucomicrobiaceae bacterium]|nr:hypothetical protein [Verrucomicrobiaceae bacterium]
MSKPTAPATSLTTLESPMLTIDYRGIPTDERAVLSSIFEDIAGAAAQIQRAAGRWVRLSEETRAKVLKVVPGYAAQFLERLQRVGEGSLHPQLYAVNGHAANALGKLPMELQEKFLSERIPVAITKDGAADILRMDIAAMSAEQYRQVFARKKEGVFVMRTVPEQRAWLKQQASQASAKRLTEGAKVITRIGRWVVKGGRAYVEPAKVKTGLTRADVVQLIKDMQD